MSSDRDFPDISKVKLYLVVPCFFMSLWVYRIFSLWSGTGFSEELESSR